MHSFARLSGSLGEERSAERVEVAEESLEEGGRGETDPLFGV